MKEHTVTVTDNKTGKQIELPVKHPTHGPYAVDIGRLFRDAGYFTYDPGFLSTASCQSSLTYLDGDKGAPVTTKFPCFDDSPASLDGAIVGFSLELVSFDLPMLDLDPPSSSVLE